MKSVSLRHCSGPLDLPKDTMARIFISLVSLHLVAGLLSSSAATAFVPNVRQHACTSRSTTRPSNFFARLHQSQRKATTADDGDGVPAAATSALTTSFFEAPLDNALSRMNKVMTADFFLSQPSLKQLYGKGTKSVVIKDSSIQGAGKGLFATKNIKAGSICCFYPAHTLGIELGERQLWVSTNESDREYFSKNPPGSSSYLHATDQPIFNRPSILADIAPELKDAPIYLDVNPNREADPLWVSQYINDGAIVTSNDEDGVSKYYEQSKRKKNCIHLPFGPSPIMATVATRKIKKGEELFTSYGCVYWLGVLYSDEEDGGPDMTGHIQKQIKESALDLFEAMKSISTTFDNQIEAMKGAYDEL